MVRRNKIKHPIIKLYIKAPIIEVELTKELIPPSTYKTPHIVIQRITTYFKNTGRYSLIMDIWKPFLNK